MIKFQRTGREHHEIWVISLGAFTFARSLFPSRTSFSSSLSSQESHRQLQSPHNPGFCAFVNETPTTRVFPLHNNITASPAQNRTSLILSTHDYFSRRGKMSQTPKPFPKLVPYDVRSMIWSFLEDSRVVELEWSNSIGWFCPKESSRISPNLLLSINYESRQFYLKKRLPLAIISTGAGYLGVHNQAGFEGPMVRFNPKIDTLYIPQNSYGIPLDMWPNFSHLCLRQLRFLAFDERIYEQLPANENFLFFRLIVESMPSLEELSLVSNDPTYSSGIHKKETEDYKGVITLEDNPTRDLGINYKRPMDFLSNFKFFLDHSEITDHTITLKHKTIGRG